MHSKKDFSTLLVAGFIAASSLALLDSAAAAEARTPARPVHGKLG